MGVVGENEELPGRLHDSLASLADAFEAATKENAAAWERGIRDMHDHGLVYDAWSYGRREHPGAGPVNPYNGQVFKRESVWTAPSVPVVVGETTDAEPEEYIPTTAEMRDAMAWGLLAANPGTGSVDLARASFDRWLAATFDPKTVAEIRQQLSAPSSLVGE